MLKTPSRALEVSPRGCTLKTSRRARSSQEMEDDLIAGANAPEGLKQLCGSKTSQASGPLSRRPAEGPNPDWSEEDSTLPIGFHFETRHVLPPNNACTVHSLARNREGQPAPTLRQGAIAALPSHPPRPARVVGARSAPISPTTPTCFDLLKWSARAVGRQTGFSTRSIRGRVDHPGLIVHFIQGFHAGATPFAGVRRRKPETVGRQDPQ